MRAYPIDIGVIAARTVHAAMGAVGNDYPYIMDCVTEVLLRDITGTMGVKKIQEVPVIFHITVLEAWNDATLAFPLFNAEQINKRFKLFGMNISEAINISDIDVERSKVK